MSEKKYFLELPTPNITQMRSTVRGDDRYRRYPIWFPALAIALLIGAVYGLVLLWSSL